MAEANFDPFVSAEPEIELHPETSRVIAERIQSAENGKLVSTEEARQRFQEWLSRSSITKTR